MGMATDPPPFVSFRKRSDKPDLERVPIYQQALELAKQVFTVVEICEGVERFYLRDALDKKSTAVATLIARALAAGNMDDRRGLYRQAHRAVVDCASMLDILQHRGTVEEEVVAAARATATALAPALEKLTIKWM